MENSFKKNSLKAMEHRENEEAGCASARFWGVVTLILITASLRLIPHPPNFTPIAAMALFGGAMVSTPRQSKIMAIMIPLLAMLLSDGFLGFHDQMLTVYLSFVLISVLGFSLRSNRSVLKIGATSLTGSVLFFLITNFAVWAQSGMYAPTASGLISCYVAALPFFQNALAGDLFFTGVLFGAWAFLERAAPQLRRLKVT